MNKSPRQQLKLQSISSKRGKKKKTPQYPAVTSKEKHKRTLQHKGKVGQDF
jgi:hypothetical protein